MRSLTAPAPARFDDDVADATTVEAEAAVLEYFRNRLGVAVLDRRKKHLPYDFEVYGAGGRRLMDVKADRWFDAYVRVVFEDHHDFGGGRVKPGWGRKEGIDLIALVAVPSWRLFLIDLPRFRLTVDQCRARNDMEDWRPFSRRNAAGYATVGWAVPLKYVVRDMALKKMDELPARDRRAAHAEGG